MPHALQFIASVAVSTHVPLQSIWLTGQFVAHVPLPHTVAPGHALPQAPQFALLLSVSTHAPPHNVSPAVHAELGAALGTRPHAARPQHRTRHT
jgi:hypothetical protein